MVISHLKALLFISLTLLACGGDIATGDQNDYPEPEPSPYADVLKVVVLGNEGEFDFHITISSPDTGCEKYADFWEVVSPEGDLIYRRILEHSHVNEQPFTRSGGPVPIQAHEIVWVRAHMNTVGYGGRTYRGASTDGFIPTVPPEGFAEDLIVLDPKSRCAF